MRSCGQNGSISCPALQHVPGHDAMVCALQETVAQVGTIAPPVTDAGPYTVPDMLTIIQSQGGLLETSSYTTRGYLPATPVPYTIAATPKVMVGTPSGQAVDDGSP